MLNLSVENFVDTITELRPIIQEHYKELALNQDKVPLRPRWDLYAKAQNKEELLFITARDTKADNKLVGYFIGFISPGLHYETCLTCQMDIFFVHPEYRTGMLGLKMFKFLEKQLKLLGVDRVYVGSKSHADASPLFERLGYGKVETYYSKWVGE